MVSQRSKDYLMFNVAVKRKDRIKPEKTFTYLAENIDDLLDMLEKNEGLTEDVVEEIVIHQMNPDNTVTEIIRHPKQTKLSPSKLKKVSDGLFEMGPVERVDDTDDEEDAQVLSAVQKILKSIGKDEDGKDTGTADADRDPPPKVPPVGTYILGGFNYRAFEAPEGGVV